MSVDDHTSGVKAVPHVYSGDMISAERFNQLVDAVNTANQPQRPKTCRECFYLTEPKSAVSIAGDRRGFDVADCCVNPTAERRIPADRIACHVGILSQAPWPQEPENTHGEETIQE